MIADLHFLRPLSFLLLVPLLALVLLWWRKAPQLQGWGDVCDAHLLAHLVRHNGQSKPALSLITIFLSMVLMIFSLSGPAWHQLPVPVYKIAQPRVLLLDMSDTMMNSDLSPNRLSRAKFKIQDLLARKDVGQFALIAYTGEPFVVSPLTDDGQTIASLLPSLTPDVMPVAGQKLDAALNEAAHLIQQAGYDQGQILVLTAATPSAEAIATAKKLAASGIFSSVMPVRADKELNPLFQRFASSGNGQLLVYTADSYDLERWINNSPQEHFTKSKDNDVPLWRDEGRWFLVPALLLLVPVFRRGWLQRMVL